jgi:hypothetical protein
MIKNEVKQVWFLTSELENERASSFRQERWGKIFLEANVILRIFNLRGIFNHSDILCNDKESFIEFRKSGLSHYKGLKTSVREGLMVSLLRRVKHLLLADLFLPCVFKLYWRLNSLLKNFEGSVILMTSSPPFSLAAVGALIKLKYPDKVIFSVDMRDAWALHTALGGFRPLKRAIERRVLSAADLVSTVSMDLSEEFKKNYNINVDVIYNVATHYLDAPRPIKIKMSEVISAIDSDRVVLLYTGSAPENFYDTLSLIKAISRLIRENPELSHRLQFVFVGACETIKKESIAHNVNAPNLIFEPHLPQSIARKLQVSADALIFLAYDGPKNMGVVSTKIFEYLSIGQPIIPFDLCVDSDVDYLLRRYCGCSVNVHGEDEILKILIDIAKNGVVKLPFLDNAEVLGELVAAYRLHAKKLISLL